MLIDIFDNGHSASFFERTSFHKIGRKSNNHFTTNIQVDGTIENISSLNCFYTINPEKKQVKISYVNNIAKLNTYPSLIKGQDKFLIFSAIFKDTFTGKSEYWDLLPIHYCINYNLHITLPKRAVLKWTKIFRLTEDGKEVELTDINPVTHIENNRTKILMQIIDYDYGEILRVRWQLV